MELNKVELIESNQDFAQTKHIETIQCTINAALKAYKDFITLQAGLVGRLSRQEITLDQYVDTDKKYEEIAKVLRDRVQDAIDDVNLPKITNSTFNLKWTKLDSNNSISSARSSVNKEIVQSSLEILSALGKEYNSVIELNTKRLEANYY